MASLTYLGHQLRRGPRLPRVRYSWPKKCWVDEEGYGYRYANRTYGWIRSPRPINQMGMPLR
jgi:hypothetical protein